MLAKQMQALSMDPKISYKELRANYNDAFVNLDDLDLSVEKDHYYEGIEDVVNYWKWSQMDRPFEVTVRQLHITDQRGCYFHFGKFNCPVHQFPRVEPWIKYREFTETPDKDRLIVTVEGNLIYMHLTPSKYPAGHKLDLTMDWGSLKVYIKVKNCCKEGTLDVAAINEPKA